MLIDRINIERSQDKMWELEQTTLSHTPGDENGASRMTDRIHDIVEHLQETLLIAQHIVTREQIEERRAAEDGVMRYIE